MTINHPPLNIFGPDAIPQLNKIITALETDEHVKVVVFDSAIEGFFLTHYDFLAKIEDTKTYLLAALFRSVRPRTRKTKILTGRDDSIRANPLLL